MLHVFPERISRIKIVAKGQKNKDRSASSATWKNSAHSRDAGIDSIIGCSQSRSILIATMFTAKLPSRLSQVTLESRPTGPTRQVSSHLSQRAPGDGGTSTNTSQMDPDRLKVTWSVGTLRLTTMDDDGPNRTLEQIGTVRNLASASVFSPNSKSHTSSSSTTCNKYQQIAIAPHCE